MVKLKKTVETVQKFIIDDEIFVFDILEICETKGVYYDGIVLFAKCRNNNKNAWIDNYNGIQFVGEQRFLAKPHIEKW